MTEVPWRREFNAARDPYTARVALGIILPAGGLGSGNVSNSGTPTAGQYGKWVTATTIQGVAPATVLSDIGALSTAVAAATYQPLDGDLTSLAAAAGTNTIYYRSAASTWSAVTIGANLTFSGGTLAATASSGIATVAIQKFTASGTYTPASGMKFCIIECVGGGGGGGGGIGGANLLGTCGGGGAGGYSRKLATAADIGPAKTVTIGAAGIGVNNAAGTNGGNTSVGSLCVANGGGSPAAGWGQAGGPGGVAGTGDIAAVGAPGHSGFYNGNYPAANVAAWGGAGGSSIFGGGAVAISSGTITVGANASAYGSGGGVAATNNYGAEMEVGNGSAGIVIITEYI